VKVSTYETVSNSETGDEKEVASLRNMPPSLGYYLGIGQERE